MLKISKSQKSNNIKLNLGCGAKSKHLLGWVNVDSNSEYSPDVVADLEKDWPFIDSSVDKIYAKAIVEHLDYTHFFNESNRILKSNGTLTLIVPHFTWPDAYFPTHKNYFSAEFFVKGFNYHSGTNYGFSVEKCELIFTNNPMLQKIIGFIPNLNPVLWEKIIHRAVGIRVTLRKIL